MKLHSMVEIALLGQFFGFGAAAAAAWWPHGLLPGEHTPMLPSFLASMILAAPMLTSFLASMILAATKMKFSVF